MLVPWGHADSRWKSNVYWVRLEQPSVNIKVRRKTSTVEKIDANSSKCNLTLNVILKASLRDSTHGKYDYHIRQGAKHSKENNDIQFSFKIFLDSWAICFIEVFYTLPLTLLNVITTISDHIRLYLSINKYPLVEKYMVDIFNSRPPKQN